LRKKEPGSPLKRVRKTRRGSIHYSIGRESLDLLDYGEIERRHGLYTFPRKYKKGSNNFSLHVHPYCKDEQWAGDVKEDRQLHRCFFRIKELP
jgi:hypothetical protein